MGCFKLFRLFRNEAQRRCCVKSTCVCHAFYRRQHQPLLTRPTARVLSDFIWLHDLPVAALAAQARLEGLEARVQQLTADMGQLRVQLARSEAERQTLAQHVTSLQASRPHAPPVADAPVRGCSHVQSAVSRSQSTKQLVCCRLFAGRT